MAKEKPNQTDTGFNASSESKQRLELEAQTRDGADPEDPDEYRASNIFWVPKEARRAHLQAQAPQPAIGTTVDEAMAARGAIRQLRMRSPELAVIGNSNTSSGPVA